MTSDPAPEDNSRRARQMRQLDQAYRNAAISSSGNVIDARARLLGRRVQLISEDDCA